jgi:hypothetical protein
VSLREELLVYRTRGNRRKHAEFRMVELQMVDPDNRKPG